MNEDDKLRLQRNHQLIVDNVRLDDVLDKLVSSFVLDYHLVQLIKSKTTDREQIQELLRIIPTRGPNAYKSFREALLPGDVKAPHQHIVRALDGTDLVKARKLFLEAVSKSSGPSTSGADVTKVSAILGPSTSRVDPYDTVDCGMVDSYGPTENATKTKAAAIPIIPISSNTKRDVIITIGATHDCHLAYPIGDSFTAILLKTTFPRANDQEKGGTTTINPTSGTSSDCDLSYLTYIRTIPDCGTHDCRLACCDVINEVIQSQACTGPNCVVPGNTSSRDQMSAIGGHQSCQNEDHRVSYDGVATAIVMETSLPKVNYTDKGNSTSIFSTWEQSWNRRLRCPTGVAYCSHTDTILVADNVNGRIMRFDVDRSNGRHFVRQGDTECGQYKPYDVATSQSGHVFITDDLNQRVLVFTCDGKYVTSFGSLGTGNGRFDDVYGITCHNGCVLVCDRGRSRVTIVTEDGVYIRHIAIGLSYPCYVAVGPDNTIYVTNYDVINGKRHSNIHVYRWDGTPVRQFGDLEGTDSNCPGGIIADHQGYVCVAWSSRNRVDVYDPQGDLYATFGRYGQGPGMLMCPYGLAMLPDGRIVVCDSGNHRMQIF